LRCLCFARGDKVKDIFIFTKLYPNFPCVFLSKNKSRLVELSNQSCNRGLQMEC